MSDVKVEVVDPFFEDGSADKNEFWTELEHEMKVPSPGAAVPNWWWWSMLSVFAFVMFVIVILTVLFINRG